MSTYGCISIASSGTGWGSAGGSLILPRRVVYRRRRREVVGTSAMLRHRHIRGTRVVVVRVGGVIVVVHVRVVGVAERGGTSVVLAHLSHVWAILVRTSTLSRGREVHEADLATRLLTNGLGAELHGALATKDCAA
jgi:hypothetical protein